jgi:hypothetical protein
LYRNVEVAIVLAEIKFAHPGTPQTKLTLYGPEFPHAAPRVTAVEDGTVEFPVTTKVTAWAGAATDTLSATIARPIAITSLDFLPNLFMA